jgi:predicted GH43/DUF377 family glycosyl hydrolase
MIQVKKEGVVLYKTALGFESEGVLNPAVIMKDNQIHIFYRAVSKGNYSSIGYCRLSAPMVVEERYDSPILIAEGSCESHGIEDPRITEIDGTFYLSYTAYDGINALGCLAISQDLKHFQKLGRIVPKMNYKTFVRLASSGMPLNEKYVRFNVGQKTANIDGRTKYIWDKNVLFFPRRINGKLYFLHRIKPDIQIASIDSLEDLGKAFWQNYLLHFKNHILMHSIYPHEISYIGGGCPPIETSAGWLLIYHGVYDTASGYVYTACAALLDLDQPEREIARLPYPLFEPELNCEKVGYVNNVCFPTGAVLIAETLYIYYGAADEQIACASVNLPHLISELLLNPTPHAK